MSPRYRRTRETRVVLCRPRGKQDKMRVIWILTSLITILKEERKVRIEKCV